MSPLAIPWFIISSIINEVSPLIFGFFSPSFLPIFDGDYDELCFEIPKALFFETLVGDPIMPFFGPFSRF
jgi:hypothetical protein